MAYISKHRGDWRAEVSKHGQRRTRVLSTKREARAWAIRQEAELERFAAGGGRAFDALATAYLARVTPSKKSADWETGAVARLQRQLGNAAIGRHGQARS